MCSPPTTPELEGIINKGRLVIASGWLDDGYFLDSTNEISQLREEEWVDWTDRICSGLPERVSIWYLSQGTHDLPWTVNLVDGVVKLVYNSDYIAVSLTDRVSRFAQNNDFSVVNKSLLFTLWRFSTRATIRSYNVSKSVAYVVAPILQVVHGFCDNLKEN